MVVILQLHGSYNLSKLLIIFL